MSAARRALAMLPLAALAVPALAYAAPAIRTQACVPYVSDQKTMLVGVSGFVPGGPVALTTTSTGSPAPRALASFTLDGIGAIGQAVVAPPLTKPTRNRETLNLIASDSTTNPAAPLVAMTSFQLVRFGLTRTPARSSPIARVTYTARGFLPGRPVYMHFRFRGITRRTVTLGLAKGVCGIATRRIRALPTKTRYGPWRVYVDQSKRFSVRTATQWLDVFEVCRRRCPS